MKKVLLLVTLLFVAAISANAQTEHPKAEVFGTYTLHVADIDVLDNETLHGFGFGAQYNPSRWFGLVGEFTSAHGASEQVTIAVPGTIILFPELDNRIQTFLFGPRVSYRGEAITAFGHFLVGGANSKLEDEKGGSGFEDSNTEFAMALGGGIDINIGSRFAIRAAQFDYLPIHTDINARFSGDTSSWLKNSRFQAGVVFKF